MEDIRSILSMYRDRQGKTGTTDPELSPVPATPTLSEIPDVFFDEILTARKLSRQETLVLMYLYRQVWCRPNIYRSHGIGPLNSYQDIARALHLSQEETIQGIRALESMGFLQTIRAGQYFVRKFFTEENDAKFGQQYEF